MLHGNKFFEDKCHQKFNLVIFSCLSYGADSLHPLASVIQKPFDDEEMVHLVIVSEELPLQDFQRNSSQQEANILHVRPFVYFRTTTVI